MVLPPAASALLPAHLRGLVTDLREGCAHLFPTRFRLATYLRWHASDCAAVLPGADGARLVRAMARLSRRLKTAERKADAEGCHSADPVLAGVARGCETSPVCEP
jgi:5'-3' exonuclease